MTAPGEVDRIVLPGKHQVVGTKAGFLTASETLGLPPARLTTYNVRLMALRAVRVARRWDTWKPWAILGGGLGVAAIGGAASLIGKRQLDRYDARIIERCPQGCSAETVKSFTDLSRLRHRSRVAEGVAVTMYAVGGAAVLTGAIGLVLNQPRSIERVHGTIEPTAGGVTVGIAGRL